MFEDKIFNFLIDGNKPEVDLNIICFNTKNPIESLKFSELHSIETIKPIFYDNETEKNDFFYHSLSPDKDEQIEFLEKRCKVSIYDGPIENYISPGDIENDCTGLEEVIAKWNEGEVFEIFSEDEDDEDTITQKSKILKEFEFYEIPQVYDESFCTFDCNVDRYIDPIKFYGNKYVSTPLLLKSEYMFLLDTVEHRFTATEEIDFRRQQKLEENIGCLDLIYEDDTDTDSNPFNISLDEYYPKRAGIKKQKVYHRQYHESRALSNIYLTNLPLTEANLLNLHKGRKLKANTKLNMKLSKENFSLFEYIEEEPTILQNSGMQSEVQTFYKYDDDMNVEKCKMNSRGRPVFIGDGDHFPLLHELKSGSKNSVTVIANNLTTAMISKPKPTNNDFIITKVAKNQYTLSEAKDVYNVGQLHPNLPIPKSGSADINLIISKKVGLFIVNFLKRSSKKRILIGDILKVFPTITVNIIREQLSKYCNHDNLEGYSLKFEDIECPQLSPEENCIFECIQSHSQKLLHSGIKTLTNIHQFKMALDKYMKQPTLWPHFEPIFIEMSKMPWNWYDAYSISKKNPNKCALEIDLIQDMQKDIVPFITALNKKRREELRQNLSTGSSSNEAFIRSKIQRTNRVQALKDYRTKIENLYKSQQNLLDEHDPTDELSKEFDDFADELDSMVPFEEEQEENDRVVVSDNQFLSLMQSSGRISKPKNVGTRPNAQFVPKKGNWIRIYSRVPLTDTERLNNPGCFEKLTSTIIRDPILIEEHVKKYNFSRNATNRKTQIYPLICEHWISKFDDLSDALSSSPNSAGLSKKCYSGKIDNAHLLFITRYDLGNKKAIVKCYKHRPEYRSTPFKQEGWEHLKIQVAYCFRDTGLFSMSCEVCNFQYDFDGQLNYNVRVELNKYASQIIPEYLPKTSNLSKENNKKSLLEIQPANSSYHSRSPPNQNIKRSLFDPSPSSSKIQSTPSTNITKRPPLFTQHSIRRIPRKNLFDSDFKQDDSPQDIEKSPESLKRKLLDVSGHPPSKKKYMSLRDSLKRKNISSKVSLPKRKRSLFSNNQTYKKKSLLKNSKNSSSNKKSLFDQTPTNSAKPVLIIDCEGYEKIKINFNKKSLSSEKRDENLSKDIELEDEIDQTPELENNELKRKTIQDYFKKK